MMRKMSGKTSFAVLALFVCLPSYAQTSAPPDGVVVNDVHSKLNETRVARVIHPTSVREVQSAIRQAKAEGKAVSIAAEENNLPSVAVTALTQPLRERLG